MNAGTATAASNDRVAYKGNGSASAIPQPYAVEVSILGTEMILFHRWDTEAVASKAKAPKGSGQKKTDNYESYAYRGKDGDLVLPGYMFKASIVQAARSIQDPRSPRKSAKELFQAGIRVRGEASFGTDKWDLLDVRRVVVQRNAVARTRPAMLAGWKLDFTIEVLVPEHIDADLLSEAVNRAGRLCGVGDFRPDFGTYRVTRFERKELQ